MILDKYVAEPCPHCSLQRHGHYDFVVRQLDVGIPVVCKMQAECKAELASALDIPVISSRPVGQLL